MDWPPFQHHSSTLWNELWDRLIAGETVHFTGDEIDGSTQTFSNALKSAMTRRGIHQLDIISDDGDGVYVSTRVREKR